MDAHERSSRCQEPIAEVDNSTIYLLMITSVLSALMEIGASKLFTQQSLATRARKTLCTIA